MAHFKRPLMVAPLNGWSSAPPVSKDVLGFFWVLSPDYPHDPRIVHAGGGVVREMDGVVQSVESEAYEGCLWNGPIPSPQLPRT